MKLRNLLSKEELINKILSLFGDVEYKFRWSYYIGTSVVGIFKKGCE